MRRRRDTRAEHEQRTTMRSSTRRPPSLKQGERPRKTTQPGSKLWENQSLLFKPSNLSSFAMAAWANQNRHNFAVNQPKTEKVEATCPVSRDSRIQTQVYTLPKATFFIFPLGCLKGTLEHLAECSILSVWGYGARTCKVATTVANGEEEGEVHSSRNESWEEGSLTGCQFPGNWGFRAFNSGCMLIYCDNSPVTPGWSVGHTS